MLSRRIQQQVRQFVALIIQPLVRLGVTPNMLTVLGLLISALTAVVLALGFLFAGGLLVLFAGIFDMFDGALARVSHTASVFGAFFDSTLDRYSECIILFGLLCYALQRPDLHDVFWPAASSLLHSEQTWVIVFIFIAAVGSLMVSYAKARAEGLGIECKTGLLARPERVVILAIGLLTGTTIWALALLAILSHVTAIQRLAHVWRITCQMPEMSGVRSIKRGPLSSPPEISSLSLPGASSVAGPAQVLDQEQDGSNSHCEAVPKAFEYGRLDLSRPTIAGASEARDTPVPTSFPPFNSGVQQE
jgi:CDP-diacylglycerol--glycerol-3-phosphate 3-phosphatidyltransferase